MPAQCKLGLEEPQHQSEFCQKRSIRANTCVAMNKRSRAPINALVLALPETAGSALYGIVDVLAATATLWREPSARTLAIG
jgi:hypothetical protein